ncbi:MAG TPA: (2Fe-2S)-binding protein [Candidatus Aquilonibacter sp.]|nr:(2Fe-2S)-binding protein [Candidatus Aquilonibacter sp.]
MIQTGGEYDFSCWEGSDEPRAELEVTVNGKRIQTAVPVRLLLSDFLRDHLGLTALKVSCGEGACGTCTVIIDGEAARSCTLLAVQTDGSEIVTLEGLNHGADSNNLRRLFQEHHALQCGYCTPGWLISAHCMIERRIDPHSDEAGGYLSGHLCRCTGYKNICSAIHEALLLANTAAAGEKE